MTKLPSNNFNPAARWQDVLLNARPELKSDTLKASNKQYPIDIVQLNAIGFPISVINQINQNIEIGFESITDFVESLTKLFSAETFSNPRFSKFPLNLVTLLVDNHRRYLISNPSGAAGLINCKSIDLPWAGGQEESIMLARESFMGTRKIFSSNSDASYCIGLDEKECNCPPILLAAVADGVSGGDVEKEFCTGQIAANAVIDYICEHEQEFVDDASLEALLKTGLQLQSPIPSDININMTIDKAFGLIFGPENPKNISDNYGSIILNSSEDSRAPLLKRDYSGQTTLGQIFNTEEELKSKTIESFLAACLIDEYKAALRAIKVLSDSTYYMAEVFNSKIPNEKNSRITAATTLSLALDCGEKIMLISLGDSTAFAFNQAGIIPESLNKPHKHIIPSGLYSYLGVEFDPRQEELKKFIPYGGSDLIFRIIVLNKKDIDGLILATDGLIANNFVGIPFENSVPARLGKELFAVSYNLDARRVLHFILSQKQSLTDDGTVVVLKKGEAAT